MAEARTDALWQEPDLVQKYLSGVRGAIPLANEQLEFVDSMFASSRREGQGKTREQIAAEYHRRADKAANLLSPVERQCGWLREIGYDDVDCYLKVFELAVFGGRRPE